MSNTTNAQAVNTNLEAIITTTLGWKLEDSTTDPDISSTTLVQLDLQNLEFEDNFGEKPERNEFIYRIIAKRRYATPAAARDGMLAIVFSLREAITPETLNVGSLLTSKLVGRVLHENPELSRRNTVIEVSYGIRIRVAEV